MTIEIRPVPAVEAWDVYHPDMAWLSRPRRDAVSVLHRHDHVAAHRHERMSRGMAPRRVIVIMSSISRAVPSSIM